MTSAFETRLKPYLHPDERLLWSGCPERGYPRKPGQWVAIVVLVVVWLSLIFLDGGSGSGFVFRFQLGRAVLMLVSLFILVGNVIIDKMDRDHTVYAITNRRILILWGPFSQKESSIPLNGLKTLRDVEYIDIANGFGAITFGPARYAQLKLFPVPWILRRKFRPSSFRSIDHVQNIYHILRDAIAAANG
jgi:hypothetical protein